MIWKDNSRSPALKHIGVMNDIQYHRGPDGCGDYGDGSVALGHRRLSILDVSDLGNQPMVSEDGRYIIVYNGEIYNYLELRDELKQRGIDFFSDCDTEVLLKAYITWGADCTSRLNGMWAFAIYDRGTRQIFLSRDRFGIKPLYYTDGGVCFGFASEMKALLAAFPDLRKVNYVFLHHFLPSGSLDDGPETVFEGIQLLLPAHNAMYDIDKKTLRIWRYWDAEPEAYREKWACYKPVESLRHLLDSAIELHMRSDVPVGTCLSGGVDSSTIVCWMSRLRNDPVRTFSGLYDDDDCDESKFVEEVRRHTGCHGADIRREPDGDFIDDLAAITWHQDMPTAGPGLYTQYHVMARASEDVTVILEDRKSVV